jgi:hypothetical protein
MPKCKDCGGSHETSYHLVKSLKKNGYPTSDSHYQAAHQAANKSEKSRYPTGYQKMKIVDEKLPSGELAGKNLKSGKVEVSEKVPSKLRKETAFHEHKESERLKEYR